MANTNMIGVVGYESEDIILYLAKLLCALEKKVAIVPGSNFAIDIKAPSNMFRLNFSSATVENIEEGIKRLGEALNEVLN